MSVDLKYDTTRLNCLREAVRIPQLLEQEVCSVSRVGWSFGLASSQDDLMVGIDDRTQATTLCVGAAAFVSSLPVPDSQYRHCRFVSRNVVIEDPCGNIKNDIKAQIHAGCCKPILSASRKHYYDVSAPEESIHTEIVMTVGGCQTNVLVVGFDSVRHGSPVQTPRAFVFNRHIKMRDVGQRPRNSRSLSDKVDARIGLHGAI
ncbi:hypothetical protein BDP55DRAFT_638287 [Colletotrichum godetiae]|uniref:Uncharacterized protein n=1 Tax=Colletotrichum godetiae TaxID=1209918 RepID=A0AAJ0ELV9_9PEZI|nr:uncharacterized protein BDP55DRAFT_638287 [Colletotrichum godetiae]KAK1657990.1 hypothetical protein BDP55DRAFT_638287 [Colletotrichum godetiae]